MSAGDGAFGARRPTGRDFTVGVEEELLVVDPATLALTHRGVDVLAQMEVPPAAGSAHADLR